MDKIEEIIKEIEDYKVSNKQELEAFRLKFVSNKGVMSSLARELASAPIETKKKLGIQLNTIKSLAKNKLLELSGNLQIKKKSFSEDYTLPPLLQTGSVHPLSQTKNLLLDIFLKKGFNISEGPEVEDSWHNFTALNIPENHPARDMQDTFFITKGMQSGILKPLRFIDENNSKIDKKLFHNEGDNSLKSSKDFVLRTQTSSVQIRSMENHPPPIKTVSIGRVYRNESVSARSHCIFHQMELLHVDKNLSFKNLKHIISYLTKELFGGNVDIRLRPSYFPFTEPSAEVDISCILCKGKGCKICKHTGWVEIGGAGMVDPNVFDNCGIDKNRYSGFAFGMGIERISMLRYGIDDLRLFTENNVEFLSQF